MGGSLEDPCVRLRLAPKGRLALEQLVESISANTFAVDDTLAGSTSTGQESAKMRLTPRIERSVAPISHQ